MLRRSQKLEITLNLQALFFNKDTAELSENDQLKNIPYLPNLSQVSCPGAQVLREGGLYLTVDILGQHIRTREKVPIFPMLIREHFVIDKVFNHVFQLSQLESLLETESVSVCLMHRIPHHCDLTLATFDTSVKEFLFPNVSITPQQSGADLDLLMEPTVDFSSCSCPRLEISTKTTVREVRTPLYRMASPSRTGALVKSDSSHELRSRAHARHTRSSSGDREANANSSVARCARSKSSDFRNHTELHDSYWCVDCRIHHLSCPLTSCSLCRSYRRYFGGNYPGHSHHHASQCHLACPMSLSPLMPVEIVPNACISATRPYLDSYLNSDVHKQIENFFRQMHLRATLNQLSTDV